MTGIILPKRDFFASSSLIERLQDESAQPLSKTQQEIDQLISGAASQLSDWRTMTSMMVGGLGYHLGKATFVKTLMNQGATGVLKFVGSRCIGTLAPVVGLATEVTFFEGMKSLMNQGPTKPDILVGPSFMKAWLHSFVNFGILKSFGHLIRRENVILRHSVQSLGMVAGEQALYQMKMGAQPEGSLLDQLARAEFTNLQLGVSMSLAHHLMGNRLISIEKGLEHSQESHKPPPSSSNRHPFLKPAFLGWETEGSSLHDLGRSDSRDTKEIKVQKYFSTGTPRESLVDLFSLFKNIQLDDPSLEGILKKLSSKQRLAAIIHLYTVGKLSSERAQSLFSSNHESLPLEDKIDLIQQISLNTRDPLLQEWEKILTPHLSIAEEEKILSRAKRAKANDPSKLETLLKQAQALSGTRKADFFLILLPIVSLNNPTDPKTKSFLNDYIHAAHENSYRLFEMSQRLLNIALDFAQRTDVSDSAIQLYVVSLLKIGIRLKPEDGVKLVHEALSALNFESRNQNKEYFVKRYVNHTLQTLPAAAVVQVLKLLSEHPLGKKPDLLEEYQQSLFSLTPNEKNELFEEVSSPSHLRIPLIRAIAETLAVYGASTGLPRLRPSPKNSNPEIQELHHQMISAMSRLDNPGFLQAATAPLQLLIPSHDIYHASNEFETWINRSRQSMLLELKAQGWRPGYPPTQKMLLEILENKEDEKPILISMKAINGKALVLNGHHRIATLITLVADGILPKRTLDAIPVQMVFTVSPYAVLHEASVATETEAIPSFTWKEFMAFHPASVKLLEKERLGSVKEMVKDFSVSKK